MKLIQIIKSIFTECPADERHCTVTAGTVENVKSVWCVEMHIFTSGYFLKVDICVCFSQKYYLRMFDTVTVEVETYSNYFFFHESVDLKELNSSFVCILISTRPPLLMYVGPHSLQITDPIIYVGGR